MDALAHRRTCRNFAGAPLELADVAQLLWAAQGVSEKHDGPKRCTPSAGALYPLEIFICVGDGTVQARLPPSLPSAHA